MSLLPDEVTSKTFRRGWRGYNRLQVDAHLRDVATDYGAAIHRVAALAEERSRAQRDNDQLRQDLQTLTRSARDAAENGHAEAERTAAAIHQRAEQAAAAIIRQAEESAAALHRHAETLRSTMRTPPDRDTRTPSNAPGRPRMAHGNARTRCAPRPSNAGSGYVPSNTGWTSASSRLSVPWRRCAHEWRCLTTWIRSRI